MKKKIYFFKDFLEDFFKNILRIYFLISHKNNKKESGFGSCYPICTPITYVMPWLNTLKLLE
jgi:hypothetical protein